MPVQMLDDAVRLVAYEHVAWEIRQGHTVAEFFKCLGVPAPRNATWNDAIDAIIATYDIALEIRVRRKLRAA